MAVSDQQVIDWLLDNPNASDADISSVMESAGVSPSQLAAVTGLDEGEIAARVAATLPPNEAVLLGDTYVQAVNQVTGSGQDQQVGGLENVITYKAGDNKVGGSYNQYNPDGTLARTGTQQEVNATKDFMDFALTAGTLFGLPVGIGESLGLGSGAVSRAVGQGLLTTGTKLGGGDSLTDALKAGLFGGAASFAGSQLSDYINANTPIDASNMTQAQFNDAIEGRLVADMQAAGLSKDQISAFLDDMGIGQGLTTNVATPTTDVPTTADSVQITGERPTNVSIGNPFVTTPTITVTGSTAKPTTQQDLINTLATTPTVKITADRPKTTNIGDALAAITTLPTTTTPVKKDTTLTTSDIIKLISVVPAIGAITKVASPTDPTTFPITPVPPNWTTPTTPNSPYQPLPPIDFGNRNLLIGTQWEKFLDPNYGKVPVPTQYSQPSNLSYNDLMGILGSKQGMPAPSALSINDVISGMTNTYWHNGLKTY
jgi:hypothetical protein